MRLQFFVPLVVFSFLCGASFAQEDMTVEELTERFQLQKNAFSEANNNGLGKTRGLKLVTVDGADAPASATTLTAEATPTPDDPNKPIAATPVVFGQLDPELQVNLHISFGFDSAALSDEEKPKLDMMCQVLQDSDIQVIRIVGHTDSSGSTDYNERLSTLRAEEVARHLTVNCGIAPDRLETIGMGERFPANSADSRADENRRVEFQALS